jgi:hypothetical protein
VCEWSRTKITPRCDKCVSTHSTCLKEARSESYTVWVATAGFVVVLRTYLVSSHGSLSRPQHPKNQTLHDALLHAESLGDVAKQNVVSLKHFSSLSVLINASASAQLSTYARWCVLECVQNWLTGAIQSNGVRGMGGVSPPTNTRS